MRDINRIEPFMNELTEIWKLVPDYRFGQLIETFKSCEQIDDDNLFYLEDSITLEKLRHFKKEWLE